MPACSLAATDIPPSGEPKPSFDIVHQGMSHSVLDRNNLSSLEYVATHVFLPLKLPDRDDNSVYNNHSLAAATASAARIYSDRTDGALQPQWHYICRMLYNLQAIVQHDLDHSSTISQLRSMHVGDVLAFIIQAQNAAVIFRKQGDITIFESFELSPKTGAVMAAQGKLVCSYPGPGIEIPNVVFDEESFLSELANFLVHMNRDVLDANPESQTTTAVEAQDSAHPRYITELLVGILRSLGGPANVTRISKRVGDEVFRGWRRSPLWLLIRVSLQTSLVQSNLGLRTYKEFMLFFMCCLAQEDICVDLPNHLLQCMSAKISRRLRKLGSSAPDWLSNMALDTCGLLRSTLEKRWGQVQAAQCVRLVRTPSQFDLVQDSQLSLSESTSEYFRNTLAGHSLHSSRTPFHLEHRFRGNLDDFLSFNGAFFDRAYAAEPRITLYDIEEAVEQGIDTWVNQVTDNFDGACVRLETLANKYSTGASKTYENNPELLSIMLLTTIELWIALDKVAIKAIPMVADYSPEVPMFLLEDLLLPRSGSLRRLRCAYEYLHKRHSESKSGWSVFSSKTDADSFSVRFYGCSSRLCNLKARIEEKALRDVREKLVELQRENARYAKLQDIAARTDHQYSVNQDGKEEHTGRCEKCRLKVELWIMSITIHEWPLPADPLSAEAVIFELDCPVSFNAWRNATFHLLADLCSPTTLPEYPSTRLHEYVALRPYLVQHPNLRTRITLASDAKPFVIRKARIFIPAKPEEVCVSNGLKFYGFDSRGCVPVNRLLDRIDARKYCTYQIQHGPYHNLQKYVDTTSHTSNEIMANQADCHKDLSIHEFIAFGHLRSGGLLQWLNILREIRGRSLSFRRPEVHFLFAQASSQAGPFGDGEWTWHTEIEQPSFCFALLRELRNLMLEIEANWLGAVTMDTISFLLRRLLASSPDQAITEKVADLLREARDKVFPWVQELSAKLANTPGDEELRGLLRDAAAICRGTFDPDPAVVQRLLHSAEDVEVLLSCAILIHDHTPSRVTTLPTYSQLLLDRDRRLSLALESIVSEVIKADSGDKGISLAVGRVWPHYRPGSKWLPLQGPNSRWFSCKTAPTNDRCSQVVHINLLDGSLLVNGKPLGRLPGEILRHPLYNQIFGERVLDILPSDLQGMEYTTRSMIFGHQVYFSLRNESNDLIIQAKKTASETIELIPREKLEGDLPSVLIEGYVHWLNLSTSIMEVRPLDSLWQSSPENWKMNCACAPYYMRRGHESLISIRSGCWTMISTLLKPLDVPQNLLITVSPISRNQPSPPLQLSVALPRHSLSFYVDEEGDLQSQNMQGMVYDESQYVGTLFGLVNRLVLRPKLKGNVNADELVPRCVIIPEGNVSSEMDTPDGHHVCVNVDVSGPALQRFTYQVYRIDTDLGCLVGNGSLTSKLYCAFLHALTSGCGIDPLTGRSGIEEALSLLRSAGCWSIMKFTPYDAELLGWIASISHPPLHVSHSKPGQKVERPQNSQYYSELHLVSTAIKGHCKALQSLCDTQSSNLFQNFPPHDNHTLHRSARRAAYLFPSRSVEKPSRTNADILYSARDIVQAGLGEHRAYIVAVAVRHRSANATAPQDILDILQSRGGTVTRDTALSLRYDRTWLSPNLPSIWIEVYNLLREPGEGKWFQLLFTLPAMAYSSSRLAGLVPAFVAFAADSQFQLEDPPPYDSYELSDGYSPSSAMLRSYISKCARAFEHSPESSDPVKDGEDPKEWEKRQRGIYEERLRSDIDETTDELMNSWPCETPPRCSLEPALYDVAHLTSMVQKHFSGRYHNLEFKEHLTRVQNIVNTASAEVLPNPTYSFSPSTSIPPCTLWSVTMDQLFKRPAPSLPGHDGPGLRLNPYTVGAKRTSSSGLAPLRQLIDMAEDTVIPFRQQYVSALRTSAESFGSKESLAAQGATNLPTEKELVVYYDQCRASYTKAVRHLQEHLRPISESERTLERSGEWPRVTPHALFRHLASNSPIVLSNEWKKCLVKLAMLGLELQRARRLLRQHLDNLHEELRRDLQNEGCSGWEAESHPDWLLIQLQGNFLVRRVQADVANEMIAPSSGANTTMQLNMGEGKSSVIIPIVAVVLADGHQLVRIIVPKALTTQMFHALVDRLGGLTNRRIYFIPFSRSLKVDDQKVAVLREMMEGCVKERGVLVVQPEHILSLRLVSVEKQLPQLGDDHLGKTLPRLQKWLHSCSRDVVDESDEILHPRFQLVHTIGHQRHIEGFPERWTTTQQVLHLVCRHAPSLRDRFPLEVEYEQGPPGSFPHLRILHPNAGRELISLITRDVMEGLLPNFPFAQLRLDLKDAIQRFILCPDIPSKDFQWIKEYAQQTPLWRGLLLLRGLLVTGILLFAFTDRRWRVDYGLAPTRTLLAVPYRAKDVPAQRAEFGHPDICIILTCLSYYYGGLSEEQLRISFEILLKQDDPSSDYDLWVRACPTVPKNLKTLSGVNIKSSGQWKNSLVPLFSRNWATVDFYLLSVVFPKEAKEFPSKLTCSGWDLVEKKERLVTGFSGTNDCQHLLPLHISQHDPEHQRGTNAKVLSHLLQPENKHYICIAREGGSRRSTCEILKLLVDQEPEIRVLLDVGAQMLDLRNDKLAEAWLGLNKDASAAIYFNEDDELTVRTRDGMSQLLISSPFAQQLDRCIIYLDDAHTRGTDMKFPRGFRAAVTLGPKVTKDRLAQGCMRMRELGHGHSIMFFAPLEVDRSIRLVSGKGESDTIETVDILHWAIHETCNDIQQRAPHWAQQGVDHKSRYAAWTDFCRNQLSSGALSEKWLQDGAKQLEDLYGRHGTSSSPMLDDPEISRRCEELGVVALRDVNMDEEQEREVIHEAEHEPELERPPKAPLASHSLHEDVRAFVTTGMLPEDTKAFRPVFETLDATSAATDEANIWSQHVLATGDYEKTVTNTSSGKLDRYLRPVQWVVSGKTDDTEVLVILSPYEANRLIPSIRSSDKVRLHVYTPRITNSMKPCDNLALYSIPPNPIGWAPPRPLMDQLNVFAGQLYLKDYETYIWLCRFLCVYGRHLEGENIEVGPDGFISPTNRPSHLQMTQAFQRSPVVSLKTLMGLRRKGMRFAPTHMGKLLDGRLLARDDFRHSDEDVEDESLT